MNTLASMRTFLFFGGLVALSFSLTACLEPRFNSDFISGGGEASDAADICSGKTINGVTGTATCSGGAGGGDTAAATTLDVSQSFTEGKYNAIANAPAAASYLSSVTLFGTPGTMTDHGALDLNSDSIPGTSGGFYASIVLAMQASSVCQGTSIFGSPGTAVCNSIFGDLTASNAHRAIATAQVTASAETNRGSCSNGSYTSRTSCEAATETWTPSALPAGYHESDIDILSDDDGYYTTAAGCGNSGGAYDTCTTAVKAAPTVDCGSTQSSIENRIADCADVGKNGPAATWSGSANGLNGEGTWKLVTRKNGYEVWRDERTKLLWSDSDGNSYTWCYAAGNAQANDPSGYCNNASYQDQTTPFSVCSEISRTQGVFNGDDYAGGTYSDMKGGMGKLSAVSVKWRLPTKLDFEQADVNGVRHVLPRLNRDGSYYYFWGSTIVSYYRDFAWNFDSYGNVYVNDRSYTVSVRCVGR